MFQTKKANHPQDASSCQILSLYCFSTLSCCCSPCSTALRSKPIESWGSGDKSQKLENKIERTSQVTFLWWVYLLRIMKVKSSPSKWFDLGASCYRVLLHLDSTKFCWKRRPFFLLLPCVLQVSTLAWHGLQTLPPSTSCFLIPSSSNKIRNKIFSLLDSTTMKLHSFSHWGHFNSAVTLYDGIFLSTLNEHFQNKVIALENLLERQEREREEMRLFTRKHIWK